MSGRVRKQTENTAGKQGPMRATLPVSSLIKHPNKNSPNSPTNNWRIISPEHALSGQRSPGAVNYKVGQRSSSSVIRRTASLDAIHQRGHCSRESYYYHGGLLTLDKATQTEESGKWTCSWTGGSEDKLDRLLRQHRLHRTTPPGMQPPRHQEHGSQTMSPIIFSAIKSGSSVPLRAARSSVEGLNQEIERLVLCPTPPLGLDRHRDKATPEGHRAPLAELLRRSVNTQTPAPPESQSHSAHSSGGSICSSPDLDCNRLGTSPHINKFLAREPPDGCERVNLKFTENVAGSGRGSSHMICPIRPSVNFQLRPSSGSAFQPLQPPASSPNSNRA